MEHTPEDLTPADCPRCRINAAAPALLSALEAMLELAKGQGGAVAWSDGMKAARAAILAAKGDTNA